MPKVPFLVTGYPGTCGGLARILTEDPGSIAS